ncbi:septum site-determining protein Ssd [Actinopolymorpha sp. B17G11]|uniref:septum site-determining protein Ssd n=1 Tax=Actinopolymorpha sp. B17G11 TaxID=3160861 RepID=UPI0032E40506
MLESSPGSRPLAVTADDTLLDDLVRLAAASGAVLDVAADAGTARRMWVGAPLVLVGADLAGELARASFVRRPDVIVAAHSLDDRALWEWAVEIGAEHVVHVQEAEAWLVTRIADAAEGSHREATTIGVVGGRGGAGASTLAAALAVTAARQGVSSFLLDGDPLGGGIELVVGGEDTAGMRWPELVASEGRMNAGALRMALPRLGDLVVLSWDRGDVSAVPAVAMRSVLGAARRGGDLVVLDLPRYLDEATQEALSACKAVLLVVPAQVRAVAAGARVATSLATHVSDIRAVVRGPSPAGLDGRIIADALDLRLAGEMAPEPRLDLMLERGEVPAARGNGPLAGMCRRLLADIGVVAADRKGAAA